MVIHNQVPRNLQSKAPSSGKASADAGEGGQSDDIDTAAEPETACSVGMATGCTDPNLNTTFASDISGLTPAMLKSSRSIPTKSAGLPTASSPTFWRSDFAPDLDAVS